MCMPYLLNGLELAELMAGPASDTYEKHGDDSAMLISALCHIRTKVSFTAKRRVVFVLALPSKAFLL